MALDALFDDPRQQGLLALGLGLLNSRGTFGQGLGQAGQQAMGVMQQASERQRLRGMQDIQQQMAQMQLENARRESGKQAQLEALRGQFARSPSQQALSGGGGPTVANAGRLEAAQPGFDFAGYADALAGVDPAASLAMKASMRKEQSKLSKLETMKDPATGQLVNVALFEDGTSKVLPYGVKPNISLHNMGDRVEAVDLNALPGGASFRMGQSPDNKASVGAQYAIAAASRDQAAATRDAARIQRGQQDENDLRKEFNDLPETKNLKLAGPAYDAVVKAAKTNNAQADINLIYGLAKLYDPNSVVREGEYGTIANSQAIPEWLKGAAQRLSGGGRLTPETKAQILEQAGIRIGTYRDAYGKSRESYKGIATRRGMNPDNVFAEVASGPEIATPTGKKVVRTGMYQGRRVVQYDDGSIANAD